MSSPSTGPFARRMTNPGKRSPTASVSSPDGPPATSVTETSSRSPSPTPTSSPTGLTTNLPVDTPTTPPVDSSTSSSGNPLMDVPAAPLSNLPPMRHIVYPPNTLLMALQSVPRLMMPAVPQEMMTALQQADSANPPRYDPTPEPPAVLRGLISAQEWADEESYFADLSHFGSAFVPTARQRDAFRRFMDRTQVRIIFRFVLDGREVDEPILIRGTDTIHSGVMALAGYRPVSQGRQFMRLLNGRNITVYDTPVTLQMGLQGVVELYPSPIQDVLLYSRESP